VLAAGGESKATRRQECRPPTTTLAVRLVDELPELPVEVLVDGWLELVARGQISTNFGCTSVRCPLWKGNKIPASREVKLPKIRRYCSE
jgi:hypothetical protein